MIYSLIWQQSDFSGPAVILCTSRDAQFVHDLAERLRNNVFYGEFRIDETPLHTG